MPAKVSEIALCFELGRSTVVVDEDQLSLAIGKHGQNVRLAARLTGWDIDILTPKEYNKGLDDMEKELSQIEGLTSEKIEKMMAMGIISLADIEEIGEDPLVNVLELDEELAAKVISISSEAAKRLAAEAEAERAAKLEEAEAQAGAAAQEGTAEEATAEVSAGEAALGALEAESGAPQEQPASAVPEDQDQDAEGAASEENEQNDENDENDEDKDQPPPQVVTAAETEQADAQAPKATEPGA
jgi:N utilization substance protein A